MSLLAVERTMTVLTAEVVETSGLLARIAVLLNPYDVRELALSLDGASCGSSSKATVSTPAG